MYSKSPGVHAPSARGTLKVVPDRVDVSIRVKVDESDAARAPKSLERALQNVAGLVGCEAYVSVSTANPTRSPPPRTFGTPSLAWR